ncbi:hypothetical protein KUTeg_005845 [Tegillarca granosa]|uniref:OTU domain-containing protein n=1 Tax=Tegillarca granosa TaxID=220873 RepID=A0ABQ9FLK1_TEGGR|nr:hypothetical protein KUTeg_005845 [Tegillarca granosa]
MAAVLRLLERLDYTERNRNVRRVFLDRKNPMDYLRDEEIFASINISKATAGRCIRRVSKVIVSSAGQFIVFSKGNDASQRKSGLFAVAVTQGNFKKMFALMNRKPIFTDSNRGFICLKINKVLLDWNKRITRKQINSGSSIRKYVIICEFKQEKHYTLDYLFKFLAKHAKNDHCYATKTHHQHAQTASMINGQIQTNENALVTRSKSAITPNTISENAANHVKNGHCYSTYTHEQHVEKIQTHALVRRPKSAIIPNRSYNDQTASSGTQSPIFQEVVQGNALPLQRDNVQMFDLTKYMDPSTTITINGIGKTSFCTPGDGNCFFSSLSLAINGTFDLYSLYRSTICSHILNNWDVWSDFVSLCHDGIHSKNEYYRYMIINNGWATAPEVRAACEVLNINISVYVQGNANRRTYFTEEPYTYDGALCTIQLLLTNSHYTVLTN